jgi:hypothetical protein
MERIIEESASRLKFQVRSPLQNRIGGLGLIFLAWLVVHWLTGHPNHERTAGLIGASLTCLLCLFFSETSDFEFDMETRCLTWSRRVGLRRQSGTMPFEEIEQVVVRTALGSNVHAQRNRVVLITRHGELPLAIAYRLSEEHTANAERLRIFLGQKQNDALPTSIDDLVAAGRDVDALRELRFAEGISLTEAHDRVAAIRQKLGMDGNCEQDRSG